MSTPRTDEAAFNYSLGGTVSADFARQLERELNAANKELGDFHHEAQSWKETLKIYGIRDGEPYDEFLKRLALK